MKHMKASIALMLFAATLFASRAEAAFITIDDSDPLNITITAGDFEGGFSVNGNLLTSGLGDSGSITFADAGFTISGTWIDLGDADGDRVDVLFALPGAPTMVTSGVEFGASSDGLNATLNGSFGGFTGLPYFGTGLATFDQNGQTVNDGMAFLSVSFTSEAVPEPATLLLVGSGLLLAVRRRFV
jgi:hypothetical protein